MPPTQLNPRLLSWASDIDEGAIAQAEKTSRMPFVDGHVALMPDAHVGIGSTVGSVIPTEGAIMPAAVGVDLGCFLGGTKVPLLNGRQKTMLDMTEDGGTHWVYSLDDRGRVVPGKAVAVKTRADAPLMRVTVSGGEDIICTPDQPFMLLDGTYREAQDLRPNESLMPLYRKWQTRDGYESVGTGKGTIQMTHLLVYAALNGPIPEGLGVHHANHAVFDNSPENLELKASGDHARHHRLTGYSFDNYSEEFQRKRREGIVRANQEPERQVQLAEVGSRNITRYMEERPDHFRGAVAGNGRRGAPYLIEFNRSPRPCGDCGIVAENPAKLQWHKRRDHGYNHKVIAVERLEERADVYCLRVEEYHNFALAAGVFVHNCGMIAALTSLLSSDLPDNMGLYFPQARRDIPAGVGQGWSDITEAAATWLIANPPRSILSERQARVAGTQFGSLGSGNHFYEVCLDEGGRVWLVLHSGSRGIGNQLAQAHIDKAKTLAKAMFLQLEDPDLAYFAEQTPEFDAYIADMLWAQEYARANRDAMMETALRGFFHFVGKEGAAEVERVNCHHNFTRRELHHGRYLWITRKGAIGAAADEMGVIPGSMGTRSYITRGLGNPASYESSSHGAGRRMGRGQARRILSVDDFRTQMAAAGVAWQDRDADALIDESPDAYKDIDQVMEDQKDLAEIVHTLHQVFNYKGVEENRGRRGKKPSRESR